ncbi:MAG: iron-containing alcohol dehydrogenase [Elusimicrobiales bacterium]
MHNFVFRNPTKIVFGRGVISGLGKEAAARGGRALLVFGRVSAKAGPVYGECVSGMSSAGLEIIEHGGVKPNPEIGHIRAGAELARTRRADLVVAVGGGSAMDAAKAIAAGALYDGDPWDFFCGRAAPAKALPLIAVPTLAASGSEMNGNSVVSNPETGQKLPTASAALYPAAAFMDPEATFSVPPDHTAYGAVDALSHIAEGYFTSQEPHELQLELAEAVMRNIIRCSGAALKNPRDYDARAGLMWASTLAINGVLSCGLGPVVYINHSIEHSVSALYDIAHGAGLAVVMPAWFEWSRRRGLAPRLARFARNVFGCGEPEDSKAAVMGIEKFKDWCARMNVPPALSGWKIPQSAAAGIAANAADAMRLRGLEGYSMADIEQILLLAG